MSIEQKHFMWRVLPVLVLSAGLFSCVPTLGAQIARELNPADSTKVGLSWKSRAKLHHTMGREDGDLLMGAEGIAFQSGKGLTLKWPFREIKTFSLSSHSLTLETYTNRNRHLPGTQRYRFELDQAMTPAFAERLAMQVQRPSRNLVPDPASKSIRNVLAHHLTRGGGTNGTLRFRNDGIDYVTTIADDNRSWRWADLQTLSKPDPYHLLVFGYRDTYTFELKEAVPQALFDQLTDEVASQNVAESGQLP